MRWPEGVSDVAVQTGDLDLPEVERFPDTHRSDRSDRSSTVHSTPIKFIAVAVVVVAMLIGAAIVTTFAVADRQTTLANLLERTEPLSDAAQNLYGQLSVADAAASTAFLFGGLDPGTIRDRYTSAIAAASTEVVRASTGLDSGDAASQSLLADIAANVPTYAGIIETARTNNRVGNPVGSAYLAEASTLMQRTILPWAEELHVQKADDVESVQREFATPPWAAFVMVLLTILVLVAAQMFLARRTRRTVNLGLATASIAIVALFGWILIAGLLSSSSTNRALVRGAEPLDQLTTARILAQQARAGETISLARRGGATNYDASYVDAIASLGAVLDDMDAAGSADSGRLDTARTLLVTWTESHNRMNQVLGDGDFRGAVNIAVGTTPGESADAFGRLDDELLADIDSSREELRRSVQRGESVLDGLAVGASILCGISVLAVAGGIGIRLREYL